MSLAYIAIPFFGNGQQYFKKDLSSAWIVRDKNTGEYLPVLDKINEHDIVHFYLNLRKNKSTEMEICNTGALSLFIEGSITNSTFDERCTKYRLDSLFNIYRKDSVLVTFYMIENGSAVTTSLLYPMLGYTPPTGLSLERKLNKNQDFIIVALLIIIISIVLLKEKYQKFYKEFISPSKMFNLRTRQSMIHQLRPLSTGVVTVLCIECLGLSLLIISIIRSVENAGTFWFIDSGGFGILFGNWLILALLLLLLQIGYFFNIGLTNMLFNQKSFDVIHFFENLRLNYYALVILFSFMFAAFAISFNSLNMLLNPLWILFILLYSMRTLTIYFKLLTIGSLRKLHLFSYFCATEIIPTTAIVKVVLY